jgi:hypothetical protein
MRNPKKKRKMVNVDLDKKLGGLLNNRITLKQ